jgi:Coenzyme PQQ synthesis protein D (PqqD)
VDEPASLDIALVRTPAAVWRRCLDGVLAWGATMPEAVMLPVPGDVIWELLASPQSIAELVADLAERFDAPPELIEPDLRAFLTELAGRGLVDEVVRRSDTAP